MMKLTTFLLALSCAMAYFGDVHAECCRASMSLSYTIEGGNCADAGGHSSGKGCAICICADGRAQVGTYCGRGSCNLWGCACKKGCIKGNWKQSFLDINQGRKITVTDEHWNS